jgi:hypothetical protein
MEIGVGISRQVVVNSQVDTLDVNATTKDVGSDTDALIEFLELLVPPDPI